MGEWVTEESVHGDGEADAEAGNFVESALHVNHGGEKNEDEKKSHHAFEEHGVETREIRRERGIDGGHGFGTPRCVRNDGGEKIGGGDSAENLRGPVKNGERGTEAFGDPETDGDRGI